MAKPLLVPPQPVAGLLSHLPPEDFNQLVADLHPIPLRAKVVLYKSRSLIDFVYFPTNGIVSAMTVMSDGSAIEVATIGKEGMVGLTAFVGGETSPYDAMVQVPGAALRMSAAALKTATAQDGPLRRLLVNYFTAFSMQVAYSVACNGLHKAEQRCCRWLLMTQDRVGSNVLRLTHEFLAIMLGVRRATVTEILLPLQQRGFISNERGKISVLDRSGLEALVCECYPAVNAEFARLFPSDTGTAPR